MCLHLDGRKSRHQRTARIFVYRLKHTQDLPYIVKSYPFALQDRNASYTKMAAFLMTANDTVLNVSTNSRYDAISEELNSFRVERQIKEPASMQVTVLEVAKVMVLLHSRRTTKLLHADFT